MSDMKVQEELLIIKEMIQKTRRETFETGYLFIFPGLIFLLAVLSLGIIELNNLDHLMRPVEIAAFTIIVALSLYIGYKEGKKEKVKTYPKQIFTQLWGACGIACILTGFVLPQLNVSFVPSATLVPLLILGIGFYVSGAIYELPLVQLCGVVWWIGVVLLAFVEGPSRLLIWTGIMFFGYVLPGIVMNVKYRNRSVENGS